MAGMVNDGDLCRKETILPILLSNPTLFVPDEQAYKNWILVGIDLGVPTQQLQRIKTSAKANGAGLLHGIVAEIIDEWLKELDRKGERGSIRDLVSSLQRNDLGAFGEAIESALLPSSSSLSSASRFAEVSSSGIRFENPNSNYGRGSSEYSYLFGTHTEGRRSSFNSNFAANGRDSLPLPPPSTVIIPDEAMVQERASSSKNGNEITSNAGVRQWLRGISPESSSRSSSFSHVSVNYDNESDEEVEIPSSEEEPDSRSPLNDEDNYPAHQQQQQQGEERDRLQDRSPPSQQQHQSRMLLKKELEKLDEAIRNCGKVGQQSSSHSSRRSRSDGYSRGRADKRKYDDDRDRNLNESSKRHHRSSDISHSRSSRFGSAKSLNERRKNKGRSSDGRKGANGNASNDFRSANAKRRRAYVEINRKGLNNFHLAVQENRISDVIQLIKEGADVNEPTSELRLRSALHLAAGFIRNREDAIKMIKLLIKNGANPNATNARGYLFVFGLFNGAQHEPISSLQFHDLVKFLISCGHSKFLIIPTEHHFSGDASVLQLAMKNGILGRDTVKLLYEENVSLLRPSLAGYNLLYYAIWGGRSVAMMKQLIDCKVSWESDVASKEGWNALHVAARFCHEDAFEHFVKMDGSLLDMKSRKNETPVHLVRKHCGGNLKMRQILEKQGVLVDW